MWGRGDHAAGLTRVAASEAAAVEVSTRGSGLAMGVLWVRAKVKRPALACRRLQGHEPGGR